MRISEYDYSKFFECKTLIWNRAHGIERDALSSDLKKAENDAEEVKGVSRGYFPEASFAGDAESTKTLIANGEAIIGDACFSAGDLCCSVDFVRKNGDGYDLYFVKSSTSVSETHVLAAEFCAYVMSKNGLVVKKAFILLINNDYVRHGELNLRELFCMEEIVIASSLENGFAEVTKAIDDIEKVQLSKPDRIYSGACKKCRYHGECFKDLPTPNVSQLTGFKARYDALNEGIVTFEDLKKTDRKFKGRQKAQLFTTQKMGETYDLAKLREFLGTISFPIYHLDFETIAPIVPLFDGAKPNMQVPTQYSLHIEYEDGRLEHREYLGETIDPRREVAEGLVRDIPINACVLAYNSTFECKRLEALATAFPDLSEHLLNIRDHVIDLAIPFQKAYYYNYDMQGRYTVKILPAALKILSPEIDYSALPTVHEGAGAMSSYLPMLEADPDTKEKMRDGLLKYCCMDTMVMVKILAFLREFVARKSKQE